VAFKGFSVSLGCAFNCL